MKLNHIFKIPHAIRSLLLAALALLGAGVLNAQNFFDNTISGINLGNASGGAAYANPTHKNWAIFALSGGVTLTDSTLDGSWDDVYGNVGIAGGCFADPNFPPPTVAVYDKRRHPWISTPEGIPCFAEVPRAEDMTEVFGEA